MSNFITPFPAFGYPRRFRPAEGLNADNWSPRVDVHETDAAYVFSAELPGVNPDDVDVTVEKNVLSLKGEKAVTTPVEAAGYASLERIGGSFERRFRLPEVVDSDRVTAKAHHGLIEITVPKAEAHQPQRIAIAG